MGLGWDGMGLDGPGMVMRGVYVWFQSEVAQVMAAQKLLEQQVDKIDSHGKEVRTPTLGGDSGARRGVAVC